jgi:hypothetical protein
MPAEDYGNAVEINVETGQATERALTTDEVTYHDAVSAAAQAESVAQAAAQKRKDDAIARIQGIGSDGVRAQDLPGLVQIVADIIEALGLDL